MRTLCAWCGKEKVDGLKRPDGGAVWGYVVRIKGISEEEVTHGICEECKKREAEA